MVNKHLLSVDLVLLWGHLGTSHAASVQEWGFKSPKSNPLG